MGWGQPVAPGKRVHSSTHENCSSPDSKGETEELSDPPPYCSKRAREISPELETCNGNGTMPANTIHHAEVSINGEDPAISERLAGSTTEADATAGKLGQTTSNQRNGNEENILKDTANTTAIATLMTPSIVEKDSGSDSDAAIKTSCLRNPNVLTSNTNGKVSQKGVIISPTRKGPRVLVSRRHIRNGIRKSGLKKSSTAQSMTTAVMSTPSSSTVEVETEEESEDESEVLPNSSRTKAADLSESNSVSSSSVATEAPSCGSCISADEIPRTEVRRIVPPIRPSYFPNVPPYINFCMHDEKTDELPAEVRKLLKWRLSPITPVVVKRTVSNSGYRLLRKTVEWEGQWGKHMKANQFKGSLKDFQKLNHIPGTFQIGRKDRLWRNLHRYMTKFGKEEFGFLPRTFILPQETKQLKVAWDSTEGRNTPWIVKPPAAARGTGIRVINKWNQVPKKKPVIVQSYVANPYLINDRKFDLRLYVLVTDFSPLKIYMYSDGLVRFAPVKYSNDSKRVGDRFMHLTNYSVNKNCELYTHNEDAEACEGHKWTLKTLWKYLKDRDVDTTALWDKMEEIVVKTLLCAEDLITSNTHCMPNRYSGYELFGFDIIIDEDLKPWLLEVNISPSLHSSSPLDLAVKGPLITEVFNIVGFHVPQKLSAASRAKFMEMLDVRLELDTPVFDKRMYATVLKKDEKQKQISFKPNFLDRDKYLSSIIEILTSDDIRQLVLAEDELSQCDGFTRIFPGPNTYTYFPFFENPRYYNMLMDAWETAYGACREVGVERLIKLCRLKIHLDVEPSSLNAISASPEKLGQECETDPIPATVTSDPEPVAEPELMDSSEVKLMDIEMENDCLTTPTAVPELNDNLSKNTNTQLSNQPPTSSEDLENANFIPSTTPSAIPLVLDNITNSPRSLIQEVFSSPQTIKCNDEDRLGTSPNTQMQQPMGDFIKGICF